MNVIVAPEAVPNLAGEVRAGPAFGYPRDYRTGRFVYLTILPRARGLSIGVNLNPDQLCNFDCVYYEVDRRVPPAHTTLDLTALAPELRSLIALVESGEVRERLPYSRVPPQIPLVQVYSATRPIVNPQCRHLPLRALSGIAQTVRNRTGLNTEVF